MKPGALKSSMNAFIRKRSPSSLLALGDELVDLDLADQVARPVAGLLEIEVLLAAHQVSVHAQPAPRRVGAGEGGGLLEGHLVADHASSPSARAARWATRM